MSTSSISSRFTACQALSFCRFIRHSLTALELEIELPPQMQTFSEEQPGHWDLLLANGNGEFVKRWREGGDGWQDFKLPWALDS